MVYKRKDEIAKEEEEAKKEEEYKKKNTPQQIELDNKYDTNKVNNTNKN